MDSQLFHFCIWIPVTASAFSLGVCMESLDTWLPLPFHSNHASGMHLYIVLSAIYRTCSQFLPYSIVFDGFLKCNKWLFCEASFQAANRLAVLYDTVWSWKNPFVFIFLESCKCFFASHNSGPCVEAWDIYSMLIFFSKFHQFKEFI